MKIWIYNQCRMKNWYWTLNGEPITDSGGNTIHANVQTIAPQLKLGSQLPPDAIVICCLLYTSDAADE